MVRELHCVVDCNGTSVQERRESTLVSECLDASTSTTTEDVEVRRGARWRRLAIPSEGLSTYAQALARDATGSTVANLRQVLSGPSPQPDMAEDIELPPHLEEWLNQLVGRIRTPFTFDAATYFDESDLYEG